MILEYWIVNLIDDEIEVYTVPHILSTDCFDYQFKTTYALDNEITTSIFPQYLFEVKDIIIP